MCYGVVVHYLTGQTAVRAAALVILQWLYRLVFESADVCVVGWAILWHRHQDIGLERVFESGKQVVLHVENCLVMSFLPLAGAHDWAERKIKRTALFVSFTF